LGFGLYSFIADYAGGAEVTLAGPELGVEERGRLPAAGIAVFGAEKLRS
jgi:hypothetical protein